MMTAFLSSDRKSITPSGTEKNMVFYAARNIKILHRLYQKIAQKLPSVFVIFTEKLIRKLTTVHIGFILFIFHAQIYPKG